MRKIAYLLATVGALGAASTANAAITIYTTQASYLAAIANPGVDTFDGFNIVGTTSSPINRTAGAYGYTGTAANNFFGAGTPADEWLSTNTATDSIIFNNFSGGVAGLGAFFFGSNVSGLYQVGNVTLTATDADGTVSFTINGATTGSFIGFVSSMGALSAATVTAVQPTSGFLWPTVNDLTLGGSLQAVVPEPSTWAMMILGFGIVGGALRRRHATVRYAAA